MQIKAATQREFEVAVKWAAQEGWNPGLDDLTPFFATDPDGFLLGVLDDKPIAAISVVRYGRDFGFLGFYIVKNGYRGRDFGIKIWNAGIDHLNGRTIGLDGVVAEQGNYKNSGFTFAHNNIRFGGNVPTILSFEKDPKIMPITDEHLQDIKALDRSTFPAERKDFLKSWLLDQSQSRQSLCYIDGGTVKGFGTIRACQQGHKIGPLCAPNCFIAEKLLAALCHAANANLIFLDVPEPNKEAIKLAQRFCLEPSFETARMYKGSIPDINLDAVFGITTFELG